MENRFKGQADHKFHVLCLVADDFHGYEHGKTCAEKTRCHEAVFAYSSFALDGSFFIGNRDENSVQGNQQIIYYNESNSFT